MPIGTRIKEIRENKNITQIDLADKLLITQGTLAKYEAGRIVVNANLIPEIAKALECKIEDLFE